MEDNTPNVSSLAASRERFLRTFRANQWYDSSDLDQIEQEIAERNPAILSHLYTQIDRHYPEEPEREKARRTGLHLLHLVYAQGDIEEFERRLTSVDGDDEDLPPSA